MFCGCAVEFGAIPNSRVCPVCLGLPGALPVINRTAVEYAIRLGLALDCDVLVPAALGDVLHSGNAASVRAKVVAEGANHPTTPEADRILHAAGRLVVPDFLANAGGVTVSYFEWVQNLANAYWDVGEVHGRLDEKMTRSFRDVHAAAQRHDVDLRMGAYAVAVGRVAEAVTLRGIA